LPKNSQHHLLSEIPFFTKYADHTPPRILRAVAGQPEFAAVYTENLNPNVMVMEPAEKPVCPDDSGALNRARDRRIFVWRPMYSDVIAIGA
jgi:hypothetical protein